jgi:hypothetical protein
MKERPVWEDYESLLPDTHRLIRHVEEQTGRTVEIQPEPAIRGRGRAIYVVTDPDPDRHLILYDPAERRFLDHLVAHECGHILRFAEAEPGARVVPIMTTECRTRAIDQLGPELTDLVRRGYPRGVLADVVPIWLSGTVAQLSDTPSDIWIERFIANDYPGLRKVQEASLMRQARELHLVAGKAVERVTPRSVWIASNAMNYALVKAVARLFHRTELMTPYTFSPSRTLGESLFAMVEAEPDDGLAGDRWLSERWAEELGLRDWLEWRRLEELPAGFRHAWE